MGTGKNDGPLIVTGQHKKAKNLGGGIVVVYLDEIRSKIAAAQSIALPSSALSKAC